MKYNNVTFVKNTTQLTHCTRQSVMDEAAVVTNTSIHSQLTQRSQTPLQIREHNLSLRNHFN